MPRINLSLIVMHLKPLSPNRCAKDWLVQVISTARTCNLILIVLDCLKPISHKKLIEHELEGFGIRLNKQPPQISFRKKEKGGITFTSSIQNARLDLEGEDTRGSLQRLGNLADYPQ